MLQPILYPIMFLVLRKKKKIVYPYIWAENFIEKFIWFVKLKEKQFEMKVFYIGIFKFVFQGDPWKMF